MPTAVAHSGIESLDDLLGGLIPGDNVVWVTERDARYALVERAFLAASSSRRPTLYVATGRSELERPLPDGVGVLDATTAGRLGRPAALADELERRLAEAPASCLVVDGLAALARRWGSDEALAFFSRACPSMLQAGAVTYWRAPRSLGARFLEGIRQITQCMLELRGDQLRVLKAESRSGSVAGSVHHLDVVDGVVALTASSTAGRLARGLAAVRQDLGLTQAQLASAAGVTPSAISQVESGSRGLSVDTLIALADRLGVTLDRLVSAQPAAGYQLARHDRRPTRLPGGVIPLADDAAVGLRAYLVVLDGGDRGVAPVAHTGVQLVAVVRGLVQVDAGEDRPVLRAGDSLLAETVPVRAWSNLRPDPAVLYWVLRD